MITAGVHVLHGYICSLLTLSQREFIFKLKGYNGLQYTAVKCRLFLIVLCFSSSTFQKLLCASVLALLCVYVARCALRSHQWRSEQSLFTSALTVCPLNAKVKIHVLCVCLPDSTGFIKSYTQHMEINDGHTLEVIL